MQKSCLIAINPVKLIAPHSLLKVSWFLWYTMWSFYLDASASIKICMVLGQKSKKVQKITLVKRSPGSCSVQLHQDIFWQFLLLSSRCLDSNYKSCAFCFLWWLSLFPIISSMLFWYEFSSFSSIMQLNAMEFLTF